MSFGRSTTNQRKRGPKMSNALFSKEPPTEDGWYWLKAATMNKGDCPLPSEKTGDKWDTYGYIFSQTEEEILSFGWLFGPAICTPSQSTRIAELEKQLAEVTAERDAMKAALIRITNLNYMQAAINGCALDAVIIAADALESTKRLTPAGKGE
jgi:hypothetical protein